jgi:small subunit ribosomal protein S17
MEKQEQKINQKKVYVGEVVSDKMDKTVVVKTRRAYMHQEFHKVMHTTKKYKVHDDKSEASLGDVVEFCEGRPVSKTKCMYLLRIVQKA